MKPLLNLKRTKKLYYCDKPLTQAAAGDIQLLPRAAVAERMAKRRGIENFNWSEDFIVPEDWNLTEADKQLLAKLRASMIPPEKFIVCFINETVGYGVFAREEIHAGSITLYGGIKTFELSASLYQMNYEDGTILDALKSGAHAQLFQDLYPKTNILSGQFAHIAGNNFISKKLQLSCGELTYLEATKTVIAGRQCGHSYGDLYWKVLHITKGLDKLYFDNNGNIITDPHIANYLLINTLDAKQVLAIKNAAPISKSIEPESLETYSPINELVRKVVYNSRFTGEFLNSLTTKRTSQRFFKTHKPFDILLKYKLSSPEDANIAFRRASAAGNVEDLKILIKGYRLDINSPSSNGMTALHWAYEYDRADAITYLLGLVGLKIDLVDNFNRLAMHCGTKKLPELHRQTRLSA